MQPGEAMPGRVDDDASPRYPGGYPDYVVNHQRKPGIGTLAGWHGTDGSRHGSGEVNPDQLQRYVDNGCFRHDELPPQARYFKHANRDYLEQAACYDLRVRIAPAPADTPVHSEPQFAVLSGPPGLSPAPKRLQRGAGFRRRSTA
ncbi:MAG: hypothetical protein Kow0073_00220 [Immundisolibacter sp.]